MAAPSNDLVAFQLFVAIKADVVATLLGGCRRAIAVNNGGIKQLVLMKLHHRAGKNGVDAAVCFPPPPSAIDAGVVDLRTTFAIFLDRQLLPLAADIEQVKNIVEDLEQTELWCRPAASG